MGYHIRSKLIFFPLCLLLLGSFTSFAFGNPLSASTYHSIELDKCQIVPTNGLVKKVDNFMFIFDSSASMTETYQASAQCAVCHRQFENSDYGEQHAVANGGREFARKSRSQHSEEHDALYGTHEHADKVMTIDNQRCDECHQDYLYSKFSFAKDLTQCFNKTIPDLELSSALRLFGSPVYTTISYGPEKYTKKEFDHQLHKILDADGASPLDMTLEAAGKDWFNSSGKIAVIVVSDGKDMGEPEILAAEDLQERYGDRICIYTVVIGGDQNGKTVMEKIAQTGQCGLAINGDTLLDKKEMANFTREIFLQKAEPKPAVAQAPPADSDGDGVPDLRDDCPDTRPGLKVDDHGCWQLVVAADVLFDFDKYNFKPKGIKELDKVVDYMNKYQFLDLAISGHTDNFGSMKYNIALSKRRATAGLNYLTQHGIDKERISASWHSFSMPRATNKTPEGRALNRRLEFKFSKHQ